MIEDIYWFLILALISEILGTVSGFGSSILFVPVASMFFDFKTVLGVTAVFHVFSNLSKIALFRDGVDKKIAVKLGVPAVVFVIVGAYLTTFIPTKEIELSMSLLLLILAVLLFIQSKIKIHQTNTNLMAGGVVSGFVAGIAGTGGAIRGITLAAFNLPKEVFIATSALIDLGVDVSRATVYTSNGYVDSKHLVLLPFLIAVSFLGSYLGKVIVTVISETLFRYIVLGVVVLTAAWQIARYIY